MNIVFFHLPVPIIQMLCQQSYSASARAKNPMPCALNFLSNCSSHLFKRGTVCGALSGAKEER